MERLASNEYSKQDFTSPSENIDFVLTLPFIEEILSLFLDISLHSYQQEL